MISFHGPVGGILLQHGAIDQAQLDEALAYRDRKGCRLGEALIALGLCSEAEVYRALAEQSDIRFVDFSVEPPDRDAMRQIPREVAIEYGIVPVAVEKNRLVVAARDPYDLRIDDLVRATCGLTAAVAMGIDSQLRDILSRYEEYRWSQWGPASTARANPVNGETAPGSAAPQRDLSHSAQRVDDMIAEAVRKRAREILLEPEAGGLRVTFRIGGYPQPMAPIPSFRVDGVVSRLKSMSIRHRKSDAGLEQGECRIRIEGRSVDLSTTVFAAEGGELLSIRVRQPDGPALPLPELGVEFETFRALRAALVRPGGLTLAAGPAGSGWPTTISAMLEHCQARGATVFSLDASVERRLRGISQIRTGDGAPEAFAGVLEASLNQMPDAILVGELPDRESVEIACRAASSGQRVLTGAYAHDGAAAVARLLSLGAAPDLLAEALDLVIAQRLLRRVCPHCAREYDVPAYLEMALHSFFDIPSGARFRKGFGCIECDGLGTRGCVGAFEVLRVDDAFRELVRRKPTAAEIRAWLAETGFRTLESDAFDKACEGLVAPDELLRLGMGVAGALDEIGLSEQVPDEVFALREVPRFPAPALFAEAEAEPALA